MDLSGISHLETIIDDYNQNMRRFNQNMSDLLEMYRTGINEERERRRQRQWRFFNMNSDRVNRMYEEPRQNERRFMYTANLLNNLQDVIIRPTNEQILLATETIIYDDSLITQIQCPISLESFVNGEEICRIKHCYHCFKRPNLLNWFRRNVRCPVCRYDIRDYNIQREAEEGDEEDQEEEKREETNTTPINTRQNITNNISNIIRNFLTNEIERNIPTAANTLNDFIVSLDIPFAVYFSYNDMNYLP
jgi:uncharacterized Zn finger protein (UPF0148 family)